MPRYVILEHDFPTLHWDLMLEAGNVLQTWRLAQTPKPGEQVAALSLPDHRRRYLDYEGTLSGERGQVQRWDTGVFAWEENTPDRIRIILSGQRLAGKVELQRVEGTDWRFVLQQQSSKEHGP